MRLFIFLLFCLIGISAFPQNPINGSSPTVTVNNARTWNSMNQKMPVMVTDTTNALKGGIDSIADLGKGSK